MTDETLLQHCRRITEIGVAHKCDTDCRYHLEVRDHECDATCDEVSCAIWHARAKLLGSNAYYKEHPLAEVMDHCRTADIMHFCDDTCRYHYDVKNHRCTKKGPTPCPDRCPVGQAKQYAKRAPTPTLRVVSIDVDGELDEDDIAAIVNDHLDPDGNFGEDLHLDDEDMMGYGSPFAPFGRS